MFMPLLSKKTFSLLVFSALVAAGPKLISTRVGNRITSQLIHELFSVKCDLCFELYWFKPLIIQDMTLVFSEGVFKAQNTKIDHLCKMFLTLDPASIYVDAFDLEWQKRESTPILKAGLNPLILSMAFPLNADIVFENGKIKQSLSQEALSGVKGYIYYKDKQPIDFHIEGRSGETGFIDLKGHLDFLSQSASIDLIGKDCPKKALPPFFLSPYLGDHLCFDLHYQGGLSKGQTTYSLSSQELRASGSLFNYGKILEIDKINTILFEPDQSFNYCSLSLQKPALEISVNNGIFNLDSFFDVHDLNVTYALQATPVSMDSKDLGPLTLRGLVYQKEKTLNLSTTLNLDEKEKISLEGHLELSNKPQGMLTILAKELPEVLDSSQALLNLGKNLSFLGQFTLKESVISGSIEASSDSLKNLKTHLEFQKNTLTVKNFSSFINDPKGSFDLLIPSLEFNINKSWEPKGELELNIASLNKIDSHHFPLCLKSTFNSWDDILNQVNSPYFSIGGIAALNVKNRQFFCKNRWIGNFTIPLIDTKLKTLTSTISGSCSIEQGSGQDHIWASLKAEPIAIDNENTISCKNLEAKWDYSPTSKKSTLCLVGFFLKNDNPLGSIDGKLETSDQQIIDGYLKAFNPPLESMGLFNDEIKKAAGFFGKNLNLEFKAKNCPQGLIYDLDIQSENTKIKALFEHHEGWSLKEPLQASIHLKNLDFPFYHLKLPFSLKKPCDVYLNITSCHVPNWPISFKDLAFEGHVNLSNVALVQDKKNLQLDAFSTTLIKKSDENSFCLQSEGDLYSSYQKTTTSGDFISKIQISQITGDLNALDFKKIKINTSIKLNQFPTLFFDFFSNSKNLPFSSSLGDVLNANLTMSHNNHDGFIDLEVLGKETLFKVKAQKKGAHYKLTEDLVLKTRISKELSQDLFLTKPLGIKQFSSSFPIVFKVKADHNEFTLFPFETKNLKISEAVLESGKILLDTDHILPQALSLLKTKATSKNLSVWFQPIRFQIRSGLMHFDRFDFLVQDAFQMALWGDIDLNRNRLGMVLGLTSWGLQEAFGMNELPSNYVLHIPVSGSLKEVKIDSKIAATKIAKILALKKGGELIENLGGNKYKGLGGALKELASIPDIRKKTPAPKTPFPWETSSTPKKEEPEKRTVRSSDNPIQQIIKMFF